MERDSLPEPLQAALRPAAKKIVKCKGLIERLPFEAFLHEKWGVDAFLECRIFRQTLPKMLEGQRIRKD